jgi:hypothetical protein
LNEKRRKKACEKKIKRKRFINLEIENLKPRKREIFTA